MTNIIAGALFVVILIEVLCIIGVLMGKFLLDFSDGVTKRRTPRR
jgi:hypothetical protein